MHRLCHLNALSLSRPDRLTRRAIAGRGAKRR
jgi:hypothetical protein